MNLEPRILDEPELEFGNGGRHVDPRGGLLDYGPLQPVPGDKVRVGIIGTQETVDGFARFLERARAGIEGASAKQPNLRPPFPGLGNLNPFRCSFEVVPDAVRTLIPRDLADVIKRKVQRDAVEGGVDLFLDQAHMLFDAGARPDVIVAALPMPLIERVVNDFSPENEEELVTDERQHDFRDLLKAKALHLAAPTQIVWPSLYDDKTRIPQKVRRANMRTLQDPATRAWNIFNALFYKAGKAPWRLPRPDEQLRTSYVGIGFYRDLSGQRLVTSTAQLFDERGRGLILRGARARTDRGDRSPYLEREDAHALIARSLQAYYNEHRNYPARIVVLKAAQFQRDEAEGIRAAIDEARIGHVDLVWVQESSPIAILREGAYPVLRGAFLEFGDTGVLYTRGSVPVYHTFPGIRVPRPLALRPYTRDSSLQQIAADTLALTKMNWNTTQFDGRLPIPITAARTVGRVLRYVPFGTEPSSDYRKYI